MDINNEVRLEVMQMALVLEDMLNRMLMRLFRIKSDDPKTLGHKSSSISFKTKVDFLYDLERIDKPTYTELLTLMEIRNQFLHNLSAESYSIVLSRLGKEKYIEKFAFNIINSEMSDVSTDKEGIYKYGVNTLYLSILVKLRKALETINDEIEEEKNNLLHHEILFTGIKIYDEALNEFSKEFNTLLNKMTGTKSDIGKIIKSAITKKIKKKLEIKYNKKL